VSTDSGTWTLDTIPRYCNITSAPDFNDEDNPTITFTNPSGGYFPLRAKMEAGGNSQLITRDIPANSTSCTFVLSAEERNTLRNLCTNSKTLGVRFTICCMSGGSEVSASFLDRTMTIVNAAPTFTYTLVDTNSDTVELTGDNTKFIKSHNNMRYSIAAAAYKGASIAGFQVTNGSITQTTSSGAFLNAESNNFSFKVTDSRGFTTTVTATPTMVPYVELTCDFAVVDVNVDGEATLNIKGNYFNGNFGARSNILGIQYRYKEKNAQTYSSWYVVSNVIHNNTYEVEPVITGLNYQKAYVFQARVFDGLQSKDSAEITARALPVFDWNHDNFNINGDFLINGKTFLDLVYPIGSVYTSTVDTSPASMFGGTWEQIEDRFLLAAGNTYTAGTTGGEAEHTLSIDEMPSHNHLHDYYNYGSGGAANGLAYNITSGSYVGRDTAGMHGSGGGQAHNNMPPYLAVYMWKRID
jgi:microcystin-dependent protein